MDRRSFLGFATGALAASPALAACAADAAPHDLRHLALSLDARPLKAAMSDMLHGVSTIGRPRALDPSRAGERYVYRTGHPSIDALRSVSGVHRERMERRLEGRF